MAPVTSRAFEARLPAASAAGDSWVARNWDSVSEWTADTALAVLLKDLKAAHLKKKPRAN